MANSDREWLDVVDAADTVVGRARRGDIHRDGLRHRAVHIMLRRTSGHWFVQKRSISKDTNPGLWDTSAAGHVDSGESYLAAALRELEEELGLRVSADALSEHGRLSPRPETGNEFVRIYRVESDASLTLEQEEIADGRWLDPDDVDNWMASRPQDFTAVFALVWHTIRPAHRT